METERPSVGTGRGRPRRATYYPSLQTASACEIRHSRHSGDFAYGQQARPRTVQGGNEPQGSSTKCETRIPGNSAGKNVYGREDRSECSICCRKHGVSASSFPHPISGTRRCFIYGLASRVVLWSLRKTAGSLSRYC